MFFSMLARLLAVLVLLLALGQLWTGLHLASGGTTPEDLYFSAKTSGAMIDRGIYGILVAVALGTLGEIGSAVRKRAKD